MEIVIFCGGAGTRLREETESRPKPMVNIGKRPILWHIMKTYAHFGHQDFVLALGYKGEMIKNYFCHYELMNNDVTIELGKPENVCIHHNHEETGWRITLADTGEKSLKGARLKKLQKFIKGDTFMATYGDGLSDVNIHALLDFHKKHGKLVTVTGVLRPPSYFGELKIEGDRVEEFFEKPKMPGFINGGYYVFNRRIFDYLNEADDCDLEYGPLERIVREGQLMVYKHTGFWSCMDTLRDLQRLEKLWNDGKAGWKIWS